MITTNTILLGLIIVSSSAGLFFSIKSVKNFMKDIRSFLEFQQDILFPKDTYVTSHNRKIYDHYNNNPIGISVTKLALLIKKRDVVKTPIIRYCFDRLLFDSRQYIKTSFQTFFTKMENENLEEVLEELKEINSFIEDFFEENELGEMYRNSLVCMYSQDLIAKHLESYFAREVNSENAYTIFSSICPKFFHHIDLIIGRFQKRSTIEKYTDHILESMRGIVKVKEESGDSIKELENMVSFLKNERAWYFTNDYYFQNKNQEEYDRIYNILQNKIDEIAYNLGKKETNIKKRKALADRISFKNQKLKEELMTI